MKKKIVFIMLLIFLATCLVACAKPVAEEIEQEPKYKYNPNNKYDERKGFFNYSEGQEPAKRLTVYMRNYVSLNNFYKEYKPSDFSKIDCIKVEDFTGGDRDEALNIINDPNFDVKQNVTLKSLDCFIISLHLYLADDSVEHLVEMGQLLYDSYEDIWEVCINPKKMGGWMSGESTIINTWSVDKISLPRALEKVQPSSDLKIGIIDTGIKADATNEGVQQLVGKVDATLSRDFSGNGNPLDDGEAEGHGTKVASVVLNMLGTNIGDNSPLVSLRVTEDNISPDSAIQQVINAINYAESVGIKIINYSSGFYKEQGVSTKAKNDFNSAIANFSGLFICAAGNQNKNLDDSNNELYPAIFELDNILVVGASTRSDTVWTTNIEASNYGSKVDIFAPGDGVKVLTMSGAWSYLGGTSIASPHVAGVAGLVLSANPNLTSAQLKFFICDNRDEVDLFNGKCSSGGRLNAYKAVIAVYPHEHVYLCHTVNGVHTLVCNICENAIPANFTYSNISVTAGHTVSCKNCSYMKTEGHTWFKGTNFFKCIYCRVYSTCIPICHPGSVNTLLMNTGISPVGLADGFMVELTSDVVLLKYDGQYYLLAEEGHMDSLMVFANQMSIS